MSNYDSYEFGVNLVVKDTFKIEENLNNITIPVYLKATTAGLISGSNPFSIVLEGVFDPRSGLEFTETI